MPESTPIHTASVMSSAAAFIQRDYDAKAMNPDESPAAVEMREAARAVSELLEAVKHEGSIRAIDAGCKVSDWRNHVSPVLRAAYDRAGGKL